MKMKNDNARNRKKQRIRPYQIKKDEEEAKKQKPSKNKKLNNNQAAAKDVPEIAYGVKVWKIILKSILIN